MWSTIPSPIIHSVVSRGPAWRFRFHALQDVIRLDGEEWDLEEHSDAKQEGEEDEERSVDLGHERGLGSERLGKPMISLKGMAVYRNSLNNWSSVDCDEASGRIALGSGLDRLHC